MTEVQMVPTALDELIERAKVVSFDVFDTLIVRSCLHPEHAHEIVGMELRRALSLPISAEAWRRQRVDAERDARRRSGAEDVTLVEIHRLLAGRVGVAGDLVDQTVAAECATEARLIRPQAAALALVRRARDCGRRIAFLSDMYLPVGFVREALRRFGAYRDGDTLMVSSDIGRTKQTGRLFRHLMTELSVSAEEILHIGDNRHSDFLIPRGMGISAHLWRAPRPNRYERGRGERPEHAPLVTSVTAGLSRSVRLARQYDTKAHHVVWATSACVAAPLLVGFVLWTLLTARERGLRRIYYLARDGQVLERVARVLQPLFAPDMAVTYMLASRQALFLPALAAAGEDFATVFVRAVTGRSVREAASWLLMDPETLTDAADGNPIANSAKLDRGQAHAIAAGILKRPAGRVLMAEADRQLSGAEAYFRRIGILDDVPACVVDVGWKGTLQVFLSQVLARLRPGTERGISGFYFGLKEPPPASAGAVSVYAETLRPFLEDLVELFCAADHGSTRAYTAAPGGHDHVVLDSAEDDLTIGWGVRVQQEAVVAYARQLAAIQAQTPFEPEHLLAELRRLGQRAFMQFRRMPSRSEAAVYGRFRHAADPSHLMFEDLAPRLGLFDALRELFPVIRKYKSRWPEASLMRALEPNRLTSVATAVLYGRERLAYLSRW
jgi:FMN phosphatase YigB (HAD superfamily)